ncbi:MAG TPA: glutathione S-transferase N-terminal domain-containing protein [Candidatus Acidoferrales bacterium]|nr:glutathione S-transferase N-terminal domain-containing protein [Candidatus Acidoferrales bacterium]
MRINLIQFPFSNFCMVARFILTYAESAFTITDIPPQDRSLVWKLTRGKYYGVPVVQDGDEVIFERDHDSQVVAKHLDARLQLGLFPAELEGEQTILWRYIENDLEDVSFRLNDIYFREFVAADDQLQYLRFKERRFGRGCVEQWAERRGELLAQLESRLQPFESMLKHHAFLLGDRPRFVDFDLAGMIGNYLYCGHNELPATQPQLRQWHQQILAARKSQFPAA